MRELNDEKIKQYYARNRFLVLKCHIAQETHVVVSVGKLSNDASH